RPLLARHVPSTTLFRSVAPAKQVPLLLAGGNEADRERARRFDSQIRFLNKVERIEFLDDAVQAPAAATAVVGELKLLVPLEGLRSEEHTTELQSRENLV